MIKVKQTKMVLSDPQTGYRKHFFAKTFILPNGMPEQFFIEKARDSVGVAALTESNEVILIEQFRPGTETKWIELPGGGMEYNENMTAAAERELLEETGFKGTCKYLFSVPYSPYSTGQKHYFVALDCKKETEQNLDPNEFLNVKICSIPDVIKLMQAGSVRGTEALFSVFTTLAAS